MTNIQNRLKELEGLKGNSDASDLLIEHQEFAYRRTQTMIKARIQELEMQSKTHPHSVYICSICHTRLVFNEGGLWCGKCERRISMDELMIDELWRLHGEKK